MLMEQRGHDEGRGGCIKESVAQILVADDPRDVAESKLREEVVSRTEGAEGDTDLMD
jgi:hypothetical protein